MSAVAESIAAFAAHAARMRATRGWSLREAAEKAGFNASTLMRAEHGGDLTIGSALKIAAIYGTTVGEMLSQPSCEQCQDAPPPGFTCNSCGRAGVS